MELSELTNVKPEIVEAMQESGWTLEQIASGDVDLTELDGVGEKTANLIVEQAKELLYEVSDQGHGDGEDTVASPPVTETPPMSARVRRIAESAGS